MLARHWKRGLTRGRAAMRKLRAAVDRMSLRNRGEPSGFKKIAAPVMAGAMRRAMTKDLERLRAILEARTGAR